MCFTYKKTRVILFLRKSSAALACNVVLRVSRAVDEKRYRNHLVYFGEFYRSSDFRDNLTYNLGPKTLVKIPKKKTKNQTENKRMHLN